MEVVEVVDDDFPCHSDGEEVVLLDLDKANGDTDVSPDMQEVTVTVNDDNGNGIDVIIETCDGDDGQSTDDRRVVKGVEEEIRPPPPFEVVPCDGSSAAAADDVVMEDHASKPADVPPAIYLNTAEEMMETDQNDADDDGTMVIMLTDDDQVMMNNDTVGDNAGCCVKIEEPPQQQVDESRDSCNDNNTTSSCPTVENDNSVGEITISENFTNENSVNENSGENSVNENSLNEKQNADRSLTLKKDKVTLTIPQHIAGRDISSLTEETLPRTGKRMLKPRFGVKVPYIHMTSQIVTQDEIAKELFERFQQKYPITRHENKPDKLFSMKLTHRLANKISTLKNSDGKTNDKSPDKSLKKPSIATKESPRELHNNKSDKVDTTGKSEAKSVKLKSPGKTEITPIKIDSSNNQLSKASVDVNSSPHIDQITNTLQILDQSGDQQVNNLSEDKNVEKINSNEELIAILEDFETIETPDANGNPSENQQLGNEIVIQVPAAPKLEPKPEVKKKIIRSTTRTKRSKPKLDPEIERQIALKQLQEVSRPKRFDSHFAKRKAENEKKILPKTELGSSQKRKKTTPDDVPEVKIAIDHYIKSYTDKRQSTTSKVDSTSNDETVNENNEEVVEPEIKTNDVTKARTMREINRLLGDEGAINMIYSLEKRRSPGNNNSKNVLPSTRRKKKDLMLKTKLVKNAMLKMSSPTCQSLSTNRLGRRSDVCSPSVSPDSKCARKTSVDSQDSDQSMKSAGNFSGRKAIPADESKIIRKHSSSSEASSVGGSPIIPIPGSIPTNSPEKHTPVKALRVYTRKNKNSDDQLLKTDDQSPNVVSKGTNKSLNKTKNSTSQKVKKQPVQVSPKLPRLSDIIKQEVDESAYKEITIRRYDGVVHITLTPVSTAMKNAINISVMEELMNELKVLENDDTCKVVLMSSAGRIFCQGLDIVPLVHDDPQKCQEAAVAVSSTLKDFITAISNFPKLLVAGVDGAAVGLGATMLVHFDLVFASDKATFETPYARLGHIAEGAATTILGRLLVAEMIMGSQRLTAGQAHYYGLVTRTLWPDRFHDELIPLVKSLARQSLQAMKTSKALQKQETKEKLANALEKETHILVQQWTGDECQQNFQAYLKDVVDNIQT